MNKKIFLLISGIVLLLALGLVSGASIRIQEHSAKLNIVKYSGTEANDFKVSIDKNRWEACFVSKEDAKSQRIQISTDKAKTKTADIEKQKDDKNKDVFCTTNKNYIQLGENTIVIVNQTEKSVLFDVGRNNVTAQLYWDVYGDGSDYSNSVDDVFVRFDSNKYKFGATHSGVTWERYRYVLSSLMPLTKIGGRYVFRDGNGGYFVDTQDICSKYNPVTNTTANCTFEESSEPFSYFVDGFQITEQKNTLSITFYSDSEIDPSFEYSNLESSVFSSNITFEPSNYTHLSTDLSKNILGFYSFTIDSSTTAYDNSNNSNDATYGLGALMNLSCSSPYGSCVQLDGVNDYVATSIGQSANPSTNNFTFSMWVYPENTSNSNIFFSAGDGAGTRRTYIGIQNGLFDFGIQTNAWGVGNASAIVSKKWTHVVLSMNTTTATLYIDGVQNHSKPFTSYTFTDNFNFGSHINLGTRSLWFNGTMDEAMIFNKPLNSSDVSELYNNQSLFYANLGTMKEKFIEANLTTEDRANVTLFDYQNRTSSSNTSVRLGTWNISQGYNVSWNQLLAYYNFDRIASAGENISVALDWSGSGNNLTMINASMFLGKFNNSIYLNSSLSAYGLAKDISFKRNNSFAFSVWLYPTSTAGYKCFLGKNDWEFSFCDGGGTALYFNYYTSAGNDGLPLSKTGVLTPARWNHVVLTYNGSMGEIYVDAVKVVNGSSATAEFKDITETLKVGSGYWLGLIYKYNGGIDEVMVFNRSLSSDEIKSLYVTGNLLWNFTNYQSVGKFNTTSASNVFTIPKYTTLILPDFKMEGTGATTPYLGIRKNFSFYVSDITPPNLTIIRPSGRSAQYRYTALPYLLNIEVSTADNEGTPTITFNSLKDGVAYTSNVSVSENFSLSLNSYGTYRINIFSTDTAGNQNSTSFDFTLSEGIETPAGGGFLSGLLGTGNETSSTIQKIDKGIENFTIWLKGLKPIYVIIGVIVFMVLAGIATRRRDRKTIINKPSVKVIDRSGSGRAEAI